MEPEGIGNRCRRGKGRYERTVPTGRERAAGLEALIRYLEKTGIEERKDRAPGASSCGSSMPSMPVVSGAANQVTWTLSFLWASRRAGPERVDQQGAPRGENARDGDRNRQYDRPDGPNP